jgi:hypothetical protein
LAKHSSLSIIHLTDPIGLRVGIAERLLETEPFSNHGSLASFNLVYSMIWGCMPKENKNESKTFFVASA